MVPVTFMRKGALKNFDMALAGGEAVPVLGREENLAVATAAVLSELQSADAFRDRRLVEAVHAIVGGEPDAAAPAFIDLVDEGRHEGALVLDPSQLSQYGVDLLGNLVENYLMIALIPATMAGERTILKYAAHWDVTNWGRGVSWRRELTAAAGISAAELQVDLSSPADARSYHLEVHAPAGLLASSLTLSGSGKSTEPPQGEPSTLAHAVHSGPDLPDETARLELVVPSGGLRMVCLLVALFTAAVFWLERALQGGHGAMLEASDGSVAILLAAPAVALALLSRAAESDITARLLRPLRGIVIGCSALLIMAAASLVGVLHEPFMGALWWGGTVITSLAAMYAASGYIVGALRQTQSGGGRNE